MIIDSYWLILPSYTFPFCGALISYFYRYSYCLSIIKISNKINFGALFLINPVSILITGFHGQFDNLAALPLLIAIILYKRSGPHWLIFLLATISLLIKHITLFAIILILYSISKSKKHFVLLLLGSSLIFLMSFLPYIPEGSYNILHRVFLYSGSFVPFSPFVVFRFYNTPLFIIGMVLIFYFFRKYSLEYQIQFSFLTFLIIAPGIAEQYFILPVITGSLFPNSGYFIYSIITFVFLLGSQNNLNLPVPSIWISVWVGLILWLITCIKFSYNSNLSNLLHHKFRCEVS